MGVLRLGGLYLLSVVLTMVLTYTQAALLASVGQKIVYNMRTDIFNHLTRLHIGFFNDNPIGRLALHAFRLSFYHPITRQLLHFETECPKSFTRVFMKSPNN